MSEIVVISLLSWDDNLINCYTRAQILVCVKILTPCVQLSSALMFDAVHVVVSAVRQLNRSQEIGVKPLSCTSPLIWQHGTSLMNYLRMVHTHIYTHLNTHTL